MNGQDELRNRLRRIDPHPADVPVESATSPRARAKLEEIMTTTAPTENPRAPHRRRLLAVAAAVAVVAALAVGIGALVSSGDDAPESAPLQLTTGETGGAFASCLQLTPEALAAAPLAFGGTVTAVDGDVVTLAVDHWYVGGDATTVQVTATMGLQALIGEVDFTVGGRYLVSAYDGIVDLCGFSGPATPELQAVYDQAFPA
jgi:hypothetical protein